MIKTMINISSFETIINSSWAQPLIGCFCVPNHPPLCPENVNCFNTSSTKNCRGESSPTEVEYSFTERTEQANKLIYGLDYTMESLSNKLKKSSLTLKPLSRSDAEKQQSFLDEDSRNFYQNHPEYKKSLELGHKMKELEGLSDNDDSETGDDTHCVSYPIRPVASYSPPIDIPK